MALLGRGPFDVRSGVANVSRVHVSGGENMHVVGLSRSEAHKLTAFECSAHTFVFILPPTKTSKNLPAKC